MEIVCYSLPVAVVAAVVAVLPPRRVLVVGPLAMFPCQDSQQAYVKHQWLFECWAQNMPGAGWCWRETGHADAQESKVLGRETSLASYPCATQTGYCVDCPAPNATSVE